MWRGLWFAKESVLCCITAWKVNVQEFLSGHGYDSTVGGLENVFVYCQGRFEPLSLCTVPLVIGLLKLWANKRKPHGQRTLRPNGWKQGHDDSADD